MGVGVASGVASGESKGNKGVPVTGVCACAGALHATAMMSAHKVQNRCTRLLHAAGGKAGVKRLEAVHIGGYCPAAGGGFGEICSSVSLPTPCCAPVASRSN